MIDAACYFSFVILKAFYPLVLILHIRISSAYLFTLVISLGLIVGETISRSPLYFCVAASWEDYCCRLTSYALPLTPHLLERPSVRIGISASPLNSAVIIYYVSILYGKIILYFYDTYFYYL